MQKLDSPERREILPPEETLINSGLTKDQIFIDIGCGIDYFSIPASRIVGPNGKVFAVDTSPEMIEELNRRISENKIKNMETIISEPYDFHINSDTGTFALMANVLHEVNDKKYFLTEVNRVLKKEGTLCLVEWLKKYTDSGPPLDERLNESEVKELFELTNFKLLNKYPIGENFISYISKKS